MLRLVPGMVNTDRSTALGSVQTGPGMSTLPWRGLPLDIENQGEFLNSCPKSLVFKRLRGKVRRRNVAHTAGLRSVAVRLPDGPGISSPRSTECGGWGGYQENAQ